MEDNYQKYLKRKKGAVPKDRIEWKEASEFWTKKSPIDRGNKFNKKAENLESYDYYEIHLKGGRRLDSYDPVLGEIISRKATDLDKISESTYRKYLSEFREKYSVGTVIRSNRYDDLDGLELKGKYILEIPASNAKIKNLDYYKKIAKEYNVELRFLEE